MISVPYTDKQIILPQTYIKLMLLCKKCLYQQVNKWLPDNCFCILVFFFLIAYTLKVVGYLRHNLQTKSAKMLAHYLFLCLICEKLLFKCHT